MARWRWVQTETLEFYVRDRQFAHCSAAVMGVFDLDPIKRAPLGERQNPHGGTFERYDRPRRELTRDPVFALGRAHFGAEPTIASHARLPALVAQGGAIQYGIDRFRRNDAPTEDLADSISETNQPVCRGPGPPSSSRCFSHGKATTFFFVLGKHPTAPEDAANCWASLAVFH